MKTLHHYKTTAKWTGNKGLGTSDYGAYDRSHTISAGSKLPVWGSADHAFRGDYKNITRKNY